MTQPDWVILGARLDDRYVVWASQELDQVELEVVYEDYGLVFLEGLRLGGPPVPATQNSAGGCARS